MTNNLYNFFKKHLIIFCVFFLFILSFSVYYNSFQNGFVYDDLEQILDNQWLKSFKNIPEVFSSSVWDFRETYSGKDTGHRYYYRPIMHLVFMIEYSAFGENPMGYHIVNVSIHFLNSVIFFFLSLLVLKKMKVSKKRISNIFFALLASMIFVVHPINTETVNWISAMPELSFTFFLLLSFFYYLKTDENSKVYLAISLIFFLLSLLSKETAISLIFIIFAYDYINDRGMKLNFQAWAKNWLVKNWYYLVIVLIYLIIRFLVLGGIKGTIGIGDKEIGLVTTIYIIVSMFFLFFINITQIIFPIKLSLVHDYNMSSNLTIISSSMWIVSLITYFYIAPKMYSIPRTNKIILLGFSFFIFPLIPALNYYMLGEFVLSERYLYLPSIGFSMIVSFLIVKLFIVLNNRKLTRIILFFLLAVIFIGYYYSITKRNEKWENDLAIFSDAIEKYPDSLLSTINLQRIYCETGNIEKCRENVERYGYLIEKKNLGNREQFIDYYKNYRLGTAYFVKNNPREAIKYYNSALEINTKNTETFTIYKNLGNIYYSKKDLSKAIKYMTLAFDINPNSIQANKYLGLFYCLRNNSTKADYHFANTLNISKKSEEIIYEINKFKKECFNKR